MVTYCLIYEVKKYEWWKLAFLEEVGVRHAHKFKREERKIIMLMLLYKEVEIEK